MGFLAKLFGRVDKARTDILAQSVELRAATFGDVPFLDGKT